MNELKPCPFCGGKAIFRTITNCSDSTGIWLDYIIECSSCGATPINNSREMHICLDRNGYIRTTVVSEENKKLMIEKWNERSEKEETK